MSAHVAARSGLLRAQMSAHPGVYAYVVVAALIGAVPTIGVPLLARAFVDQYLVAGLMAWGRAVAVAVLALLLARVIVVYLTYVVLSRLVVRLSATLSLDFVWHVLRLPVAEVQRIGIGSLAARSTATQRQAFVSGMLLPFAISNIVMVVALLIALVLVDLPIGIASAIVVAGSVAASIPLLRRRAALQQRADDAAVALTATTTSLVSGIETLKASAWEQWAFNRWSRSNSLRALAVSRLGADGQRLGIVPPLTQAIGLGVVLVLGASLVVVGRISLGTLVASQALLVAVLVPAGQLVWIGVLRAGLRSTDHQLGEVTDLALDPEAALPDPTAGTPSPGAPGVLRLHEVDFGYDRGAPPLLRGLTVDVPAGSWLAVVGSSGSGKSTLAKLVVGETQPWSGQVLLDGVPRLEVPRAERGTRVGYVPQHPVLMPGSIVDNITLFDPTIPRDRVMHALADARILDTIMGRPAGLDERVSPTGHGFSGGELQRIAIARALVREPGLLVLDEATSALDPVVEEEIGQILRARGCTCLVIAHRLSTVRDADQIIVLDRGQVVQRGTFDELRAEGQFAELVHG